MWMKSKNKLNIKLKNLLVTHFFSLKRTFHSEKSISYLLSVYIFSLGSESFKKKDKKTLDKTIHSSIPLKKQSR